MRAVNRTVLTYCYVTALALVGCTSGSSSPAPASTKEVPKENSENSKVFVDTSGDKIKKLYSFSSALPIETYIDDNESILVSVSGSTAQIIDLQSGKIKNEISFGEESIKDCQITDNAILLMSYHQIKILDLKTTQLRHSISAPKQRFRFATITTPSFSSTEYETALLYQLMFDNLLPRTYVRTLKDSEKEISVSDVESLGNESFLVRADFENGTKSSMLIQSRTENPYVEKYPQGLGILGGWTTATTGRTFKWDETINYVHLDGAGDLYFGKRYDEQTRIETPINLEFFQYYGFFDEKTVHVALSKYKRLEQRLVSIAGPKSGTMTFSTEIFLQKNNLNEPSGLVIKGGSLERNILYLASRGSMGQPDYLYASSASHELLGKFKSDEGLLTWITPKYVVIKNMNEEIFFYSTDLNKEIFRKVFGDKHSVQTKFNFSSSGKYVIYTHETKARTNLDVWIYDEKK